MALEQGENTAVRIRRVANAAGAIDIAGGSWRQGWGNRGSKSGVGAAAEGAVWVSQDPEGTEAHLSGSLAANKFEFAPTKTLPANLDDTR